MANEYAVNQADLTAVADAIREKGGTSDALEFPGGFADAIGAIQAGGDSDDLVDLISRTLTRINNDKLTKVGEGALSNCTLLETVNLPNVEILGGSSFAGCTSLKTVNLPKVTTFTGGYVFNNAVISGNLVLEQLAKIGKIDYVFRNISAHKITFPKLESIEGQAFRWTPAGKLNIIDTYACTRITVACFNSTSVPHFLLRANSVCVLDTLNAGLVNVYVPSTLIEEYKVATNWVDLYTDNPDLFHALEEYTVDGTIDGEFDESKI